MRKAVCSRGAAPGETEGQGQPARRPGGRIAKDTETAALPTLMETRGTGYQRTGPFAEMEIALYARLDRGTVISSGGGGRRTVVARIRMGRAGMRASER
jgi:hypothetical protein